MKDESNVHIGKRSSGWKFLWDANNFKCFSPDKESIIGFLKSGQIVDEEGIGYTSDEFFNEEISSFLTEGIDLKEHYGKENVSKSMYRVPDDVRKAWKDEHGIDVSEYGEFYISNSLNLLKTFT